MNAHAPDPIGIPEFPDLEAQWAPVYLEPIVESGERLTIGIVAHAGGEVSGCLTITEKALQCLYGESSGGMKAMMDLALKKAMTYAKLGFLKGFQTGIHGVVLGEARAGFGYDLDDILSQGASLCSSLSTIHAEDIKSGHDRSAYWLRVQKAMVRVDKTLVPHFNVPVGITVRGSNLSLQCDYFSSRIAVNVCSLPPSYRLGQLFDAATSKIFRLEQLKNHDALIEHDQMAAMMLVLPTDSAIDDLKPAAKKNFLERVLLLQDMADKKDFEFLSVHSAFQGAKEIQRLEKSVA